ncbi:MAG: RNA polymerase sigma factor [Bacteroidales bacterium]|nr:RNA polymerase sigma factor [Bacteroidales bacterium]MDD2571313.1 RNA polymerase sigma factor [Bacteroidales bacterium]MDD2812506.1 RNA polymerase sigma factor [Bacteroidales bacterium]MDD3385791.1 RNA polymerase sigma factor [Bacteroidales bacterium]MDD3811375.1 RNA polymerase sigma factor [Bacteroidales bacterium]
MTIDHMDNKEKLYKQIIEENQGRIRSVCKHYAGKTGDSDDLYQEILINIWKGMESFRGDSKRSTWVYRVAVNTALTYLNRKNKYLNFNMHWDDGRVCDLVCEDMEEKVRQEAQMNLISNLMNQLSVVDKIIISLMLEELSSKEIAEIVGITETNVRVKIHRIKEDLRSQVKGGLYEDQE